jgi:hypothetical protein
MRRIPPSRAWAAALIVAGTAAPFGSTPVLAQQVISAGFLSGRLEQTDRVANDRFYDEYRYRGRQNERLTIVLRSGAFDAFLTLRGPGSPPQENDDDGRSPHARIEYRLPATGTYTIRVTSSASSPPRKAGAYTLQVTTDRPSENGRVSLLPPPPPPPPVDEIENTVAIAGTWSWTETVGQRGSPHFCDNYGFMTVEANGPLFNVRFEQKGQCILEGRTVDSANTFSSTGNPLVQAGLPRNSVRFTVNRCVYTGKAEVLWHLEGTVRCVVRLNDGTQLPVTGNWSAVREN